MQPFIYNNLVLIYNGEIYNYLELKKDLDMEHERLMNGEIEKMSIEDFDKKHRARYGL